MLERLKQMLRSSCLLLSMTDSDSADTTVLCVNICLLGSSYLAVSVPNKLLSTKNKKKVENTYKVGCQK